MCRFHQIFHSRQAAAVLHLYSIQIQGKALILQWIPVSLFLVLVFKRFTLLQDCYLVSILNELAGNSFMIFCSTCNNAQRVALMLRNLGITAIPLHGQMSQVELALLYHFIKPWCLKGVCLLRHLSLFCRINVSELLTSSNQSLVLCSWRPMWRLEVWTSLMLTVSSTMTSPHTLRYGRGRSLAV